MPDVSSEQMESQYRVTMKQALRKMKCPFENNDTTARLEALCKFCEVRL